MNGLSVWVDERKMDGWMDGQVGGRKETKFSAN